MAYVNTDERPDPRKAQWLAWLAKYGADRFLDAFLRTAQGAQSQCEQCGRDIYLDVIKGGGVPDWEDETGDYGCTDAPETCWYNASGDECFRKHVHTGGTGSHKPRRREEDDEE